ncbi:MAG: molybdopterin molybdotransferase MoeA [Chloroflexi bacterium]|nr:molybdopterin molybdotransferase MoeA [Chloroflexota bacterium]
MISVEEALERILSYVDVLEPEEKPLLDTLGQVLAGDAVAAFNIPPLDNTAMDGYAVRSRDTAGAGPDKPVELRVTGEVAAGYIYDGAVEPGTAVRIMTGAPIPRGADAIVPFEETDEPFEKAPSGSHRTEATVRVFKQAKPGANIRRAGEDVREGQTVVPAGTVLRPQEIGALASLGRDKVRVIRRPVVAVLSTGDELVEVGQPKPPGKIYDSNAYSVATLIARFGGIPRLLGIASDTVASLTERIRRGLDADMLITSAGVSRGDYDVVKDVLAREGEVAFWTVAMKPGKPLAFGCFYSPARGGSASGGGERRIPHIGLPGNPVSSMVAFELFGRPAILKMMGKNDWERPRLRAVAEERIVNRNDPRVFYARCVVTVRDGRYYVSLTGPQGSGILTSMVQANALTVIPADVDVVEPGEEIDVIMLDWSHGEEWGQATNSLSQRG